MDKKAIKIEQDRTIERQKDKTYRMTDRRTDVWNEQQTKYRTID